MAKSLNRASIIGNLTRDPEMRYTPSGTAVCTFSIATNRSWKVDSGDTRDDVEYHRIVAWDKLAEICSQLLKKGNRTFVEGRIQTRKWTGKDEVERSTTEIVISDMILLERSPGGGQSYSQDDGDPGPEHEIEVPDDFGEDSKKPASKSAAKTKSKDPIASLQDDKSRKKKKVETEDADDDIPF